MQHVSYADYKKAKYAFGKEIRNAAQRTEQQEFDGIGNTSEIDHVKFWRYVSRKRGNKLTCDGETISDPNILANL
jgi:hypothetical protein